MTAAASGGISDYVVFWVFAPTAVGAALAMLFARKAVHSALFLIVNFFCLAMFFLVLGSPFLFAVQIIVYAGAIMVLFLFVIMLLGVASEESLVERMKAQRPLAILLGLGLATEVFFAVRLGVGLSTRAAGPFVAANRGGNVRALARLLFNGYFFPFEATSVLLIVAAVAAVVIAGRRSPFVPPGDGEVAEAEATAAAEPEEVAP